MKTKWPTGAFLKAWQEVVQHVAAAVTRAKREGEPMTERHVEAVLGKMKAAFEGVRGNRSSTSPVTWADARLWMAATLRAAVEELEATE